jgi:hypothetical protein
MIRFAFSLLVILLIAAHAFAGLLQIQPIQESISPSHVEQALVLQQAGPATPAVVLVKSDNGGSSDRTSYYAPSSLYLGIHLDGEQFDINGTYLIHSQVNEVIKATFDKDSGMIELELTQNTPDAEGLHRKYRLFLADVLHEVQHPQKTTNVNYELTSTIGIQTLN